MTRPVRQRNTEDLQQNIPVHVVWEITLACDLKCKHCGSRAGARRERELTTAECIDVVDALARLEAREVTLIGGEAYPPYKDGLPDYVHIKGVPVKRKLTTDFKV